MRNLESFGNYGLRAYPLLVISIEFLKGVSLSDLCLRTGSESSYSSFRCASDLGINFPILWLREEIGVFFGSVDF